MTFIKGCGLAIIQNYKGNPSVFVIHNNNRGTWEIPGGKREQYHTSEYTAHKELHEETCGMFNISSEVILTFPFVDVNKIYRIYYTCVDNSIKKKVYHHNRKILKKLKNVPSYYMETDNITRINLAQFKKDYETSNKINKDLITRDYKGRKIVVFQRDKTAIYHMASNIGNISSIRLNKSKMDPFNGLYSYWL